MVDPRHKELADADIKKISETYHAWRGELKDKKYRDVPAFCKSVSLEDVSMQGFVLTPGRYVGAEEEEDESVEVFDEKMERLTSELSEQMKQGRKLDDHIERNLESIGFKT